MEIRVDRRERATILSVSGSIDGATAPELSAAFRKEVDGGRVRLVGDFSEVDYTSSAGLRALLETVKETRKNGGDLRLAAVRPEVLRVLDLSGFTGILKLFGSADAAAESFSG
jgi:anti-sigma B factor antagonist